MRSLVKNLSEVTAGLLLDKDRCDQELKIGQRHATAKVNHRLAKRQPETLLIGGAAKLGTQWIVGFLSDSLHGGRQCLARPHAARH